MKKTLFYQIILIVWIGIFSSCSSKHSGAELLPDNVAAVFTFNVKDIIGASEMDKHEGLKDDLISAVKSSGIKRKIEKKLLALMDDPSALGIDFKEPFFLAHFDAKNNQVALTGSLTAKENLEENIESFLDDLDLPCHLRKYEDKSDLKYLLIGEEVILMYNSKNFIITHNVKFDDEDDFIEDTAELFDMKENFSTTEGYSSLQDEDGLVKLYVALTKYLDTREMKMAMISLPESYRENLQAVKDMSIVMTLNAPKGMINYTAVMNPGSKEAKKLYEELTSYTEEIEGDFLSYIEENSLFTAMFNLNGEKYAELLKKTLKEFPNAAQLDKVLPYVKKLNGDMAFNCHAKMIDNATPAVDFFCKISDPSMFDDVTVLMGDDIENKGENSWYYPLVKSLLVPTGKQVYNEYLQKWEEETDYKNVEVAGVSFGYQKKNAYLMFDKHYVLPEKVDQALDSKNIKGAKCYARFNVNEFLNIDEFSPIFSGYEERMVKDILEEFESIEMIVPNNYRVEMHCIMNNKEESPLSLLIGMLQKAFG